MLLIVAASAFILTLYLFQIHKDFATGSNSKAVTHDELFKNGYKAHISSFFTMNHNFLYLKWVAYSDELNYEVNYLLSL